MAIAPFRVDTAERIAVISWPGVEADIDDWVATTAAVLDAPGFAPEFGIISDRRRGSTRPPRAAYVNAARRWLCDMRRQGRFTGRLATVTQAAEPALFAMWLTLEGAASDGYEYQVFIQLEAAVRWVKHEGGDPPHSSAHPRSSLDARHGDLMA